MLRHSRSPLCSWSKLELCTAGQEHDLSASELTHMVKEDQALDDLLIAADHSKGDARMSMAQISYFLSAQVLLTFVRAQVCLFGANIAHFAFLGKHFVTPSSIHLTVAIPSWTN